MLPKFLSVPSRSNLLRIAMPSALLFFLLSSPTVADAYMLQFQATARFAPTVMVPVVQLVRHSPDAFDSDPTKPLRIIKKEVPFTPSTVDSFVEESVKTVSTSDRGLLLWSMYPASVRGRIFGGTGGDPAETSGW